MATVHTLSTTWRLDELARPAEAVVKEPRQRDARLGQRELAAFVGESPRREVVLGTAEPARPRRGEVEAAAGVAGFAAALEPGTVDLPRRRRPSRTLHRHPYRGVVARRRSGTARQRDAGEDGDADDSALRTAKSKHQVVALDKARKRHTQYLASTIKTWLSRLRDNTKRG
jgi:hypothetical protein